MALLEHKARNLDEAIKNLEPVHSLEIDELEDYYVEREHSPIKRIAKMLNVAYPQKFLLTGHRGNGKSTELAKLEAHLQDQFFIVRYPLRDTLNLFDLQYLDVLISIVVQLAERVEKAALPLAKETLTRLETLWSFGQDIDIEYEDSSTIGREANLGVGGILRVLMHLGVRIRNEHSTREAVRARVQHRISDLLEGLDTLSRDIETQTQKRVLCIVEDLDKTDLSKAKDIFYSHGESISAPELAIIYTFPVALSRSNEFNHIANYFSATYTLPNFKVEHKNAQIDEIGRAALKMILLNRLEPSLLADDALDLLINYSGGVPRELIRLTRDACVEAAISESESAQVTHVKTVISEEIKRFKRMLSEEQLSLLRAIKRDRDIDQTEAYQNLLHTLSLLEYENDELWYDVNPLVADLLRDQNAYTNRDRP